ncbi:MAG: DUF4190 domain-containing protein [Planctomycetota bacterium]
MAAGPSSSASTNTMGLIGFVLSIVGFFTGGCISLIGLVFCLIGLGKEPRGLAIAGLVISVVTLVGWIVIIAVFGVAAIAFAAAAVGLASLVSATAADFEVITGALDSRYAEAQAYPGTLDELDLAPDVVLNDSGVEYLYTPLVTGYELRDIGFDGDVNTDDDTVLTLIRNADGSVSREFSSPYFESLGASSSMP